MPHTWFPRRCPAALAFILGWRARLWLLSPRRLLGSLPLGPGLRVLDLGAGPGVLSGLVAGEVPGGSVVLVDAQRAMLVKARRRLAAGAPARVAFVQSVAERLPLADDTFDIVLLVTVLGELDDRAAALAEAHRVLKPGGVDLGAPARPGLPLRRLGAPARVRGRVRGARACRRLVELHVECGEEGLIRRAVELASAGRRWSSPTRGSAHARCRE